MRWIVAMCLWGLVSACAPSADLEDAPVPLGDFRLSHNVVVASKAQKSPLSRPATQEQLETTMRNALAERFGRYEGDRLYHFGVSVEGYMLAPPGVPVVASPKSILIVNFTLWDDAAGVKLNDPPQQITVLETFGTNTLIGSGFTLTPEEQLQELARNAAKAIERYLVRQQQAEGWFSGADVSIADVSIADVSIAKGTDAEGTDASPLRDGPLAPRTDPPLVP